MCNKGTQIRRGIRATPFGTAEHVNAQAAWQKHRMACRKCRHGYKTSNYVYQEARK